MNDLYLIILRCIVPICNQAIGPVLPSSAHKNYTLYIDAH